MLLYNKLCSHTEGIFTFVSRLVPLLVAVWSDDVTSPQFRPDPLCYAMYPYTDAIFLGGGVVRRPERAETTTHARSNQADGQCNQERPRPPCCIAAGFSPVS